MWFHLAVLILGLAITSLGRIAGVVLILAMAFALGVVASVIRVVQVWVLRHDPERRDQHVSTSQGAIFPRRLRRWIVDESDRKD